MTSVTYYGFSVPKLGHAEAENEDIFLPHPKNSLSTKQVLRAIVCDGTSQGIYSREWAHWIATRYIEAPPETPPTTIEALSQWVHSLQVGWHAKFAPAYLDKMKHEKDLDDGRLLLIKRNLQFISSGATCLMLHIDLVKMIWTAAAIGDTLLFHVRDNQLLPERPYAQMTAGNFSNMPQVLTNTLGQQQDFWDILDSDAIFAHATIQAGDTIVMMTDALAQCWLNQYDDNPADALAWLQIDTQQAYEAQIEKARESNQLHNDDTTLVRITISADS